MDQEQDDGLFWGTDSEGRLCSFRYEEVVGIEIRATMKDGEVRTFDPDDPATLELLQQQGNHLASD